MAGTHSIQDSQLEALAVVLHAPHDLSLSRLPLDAPGDTDLVVDIDWSGISTGTERLLCTGTMPPFPGMGYPLVPGYESVGRVSRAGRLATHRIGERVFVPGSRCFGAVKGLFGGAASRLVVADSRVVAVDEQWQDRAVLLALAATAQHALGSGGDSLRTLIVGHGVLGRLLARLAVAHGNRSLVVWERNAQRRAGADGYLVVDPAADTARDYQVIYDVSGDERILDELIARAAPGAEIVLAGFYSKPLAFAFPPAFMREIRLRVAAEWREADLHAVQTLLAAGDLALDGLITHRAAAAQAPAAYHTAFNDPDCLKMVLDWRSSL
jgi:3-hydroxyethyl bacteriochlorophyllide a dehydrogenase